MELPVGEVLVVGRSDGVEARKHPAVKGASLGHGDGLRLGVKAVERSVIGMEFVDVPRGQEHLRVGFTHTVGIELHGVPRGTCGDHVPARSVGSFSVEVVPRVDDVTSRLGHLLALCIENQTEREAALVRHVVENGGRNGQQGVEPSPSLVHTFANVVHGEGRIETLLFVEGVVPLGKGCAT